MELDDLKNDWNQLQTKTQENAAFDVSVLKKITRQKIQSRLLRIVIPELTGSLFCVFGAIFIGLNFYRLNSIAFEIAGYLSIAILLLLPVISWFSIEQLHKMGNITKPYAETVKDFATQKIKFCRLQKSNFILAHLLLVTLIIVSVKIFGANATTGSKHYLFMAIMIGYAFLLFFSSMVWKNYNKIILQAGQLLHEVNS